MTVRNLDLLSIHYVVRNMRHQDWIEISNLVPRAYCEPDLLAMMVMQVSTLGFVVDVGSVPCAVVQAVQKHNGCWAVGMFATEEFPHCWREVFKHVRNVLIPAIVDAGGRYCEAHVHAGNIDAQRFLRKIGLRPRSDVLEGYGSFGEPFILYAVTKEELPHVLR